MSRPMRIVTIELALDPEQIWETDTGHLPGQRMGVFYLKWNPVSIYVEVSGYIVQSRDPLVYDVNWRKTVEISEVPSAVKAQLIGACHPADLAKS